MKKAFLKLTALFLVLALTLTGLCIGITADTKEPDLSVYSKGGGYVALGDSFTRGMGADAPEETAYQMDKPDGQVVNTDMGYQVTTTKYCRSVNGAFSKIIADAVGCQYTDDITDKNSNYWPIAQNGLTTSFINDLIGIDDGYFDTEYSHNPDFKGMYGRYATDLYYFGNENSVSEDGTGVYGSTGICGDIRDLIENAGLITIELGMSDILNRSASIFDKEYMSDDVDLSDPAVLADAAKLLVETLYEGYDSWKDCYIRLLEYITKSNTTGTVVIMGAVNPVCNAALSDELPLPVGTAFSAITTLMNQYMKQWAKEYDCIYVDISNTELGFVEYDWSLMSEDFSANQHLATHPTPNGHKQIVRLVLNALTEHLTGNQSNIDNIVVDLGRFSSVDYVLVDGMPVTNYSVEDSVLIIPSRLHNKKNLTIGVRQNGKLSVTTYELAYHNGYTAYRIYTTNSVSGTLTKLGSSAKSVATKVLSLFNK